MSLKAARGTKRLCPNCDAKFYDLNRDPIICPSCQSVYAATDSHARSIGGNDLDADADDDAVLDAGRGGVEFIPLEQADEPEGDTANIEDDDLGDVGEDDDDLDTVSADEAFLENDDEGEADMSGLVGGGSESDEEI